MNLRIGIGYDIHRLEPERPLYLGGIEVPYDKGLKGHSDGDVLIHAIIDALLGAMGDKDIGQYFPDTDPKYKNIRSTELLTLIAQRMKAEDYAVINVDSVIAAEAPKLASFIPKMKDVLCPILELNDSDLGIKAKTQEGMGVIGQGEAIAAWATVLLLKE